MKKIILSIILLLGINLILKAQYLPDTVYFCYAYQDSVSLSDQYEYDTVNIYWEYPDGSSTMGQTSVYLNQGGIYRVSGYLQGGTYFEDSSVVIYKRCEPFDFSVAANGSFLVENDTTYICADSILQVNISFNQLSPEPCYNSNFFYGYIYFDDSLYYFDYINNILNIKYKIPGTYLLDVTVFDERACPATNFYYIKVCRPPHFRVPDTLYLIDKRELTADTTNAFLNFYSQKSVLVHEFSADYEAISQDMSSNELYFEIVANAPGNAYVHNIDDITVTMLLSSSDGNSLDLKLYSPDGQSANLIYDIGFTEYYLIGEPVIEGDINDVLKSVPSWFLFNYNESEIYPGSNLTSQGGEYLDPAGNLYQVDYYQVKSSNFSFTPSNLLGAKINGRWVFWGSSPMQFSKGIMGPASIKFPQYDFITYTYPRITWFIDGQRIEGRSAEISPENQTLRVVVANDACVVEKEIELIKPQSTISNTITPNGDGINDFWTVTKTLPQGSFVKIFASNGKLLGKFAVEQYPQGWDGTLNGRLLPAGSYYFVAFLPDGSNLKGIINIITQK